MSGGPDDPGPPPASSGEGLPSGRQPEGVRPTNAPSDVGAAGGSKAVESGRSTKKTGRNAAIVGGGAVAVAALIGIFVGLRPSPPPSPPTTTTSSQPSPSSTTTPAPDAAQLAVTNVSQQGCQTEVPSNWSITVNSNASNLDAVSPDRSMDAAWAVWSVNEALAPFAQTQPTPLNNPNLYSADPSVAVRAMVNIGESNVHGANDLALAATAPVHFASYTLMELRGSAYSAYVLYATFPGAGASSSYIVAMRVATVSNANWDADKAKVFTMATSIRCTTQLQPSSNTSPDLSGMDSAIKQDSASGTSDYNSILDTEYVNDPGTGDTYLVDTSQYWDTGPDGPGYYKHNGNDWIKLSPGIG